MALEMDLGPQAEKFRDELRQWLEANRPVEPFPDLEERAMILSRDPKVIAWGEKLHEAGYMCVSWPKEFGGRGLTALEVAVMNEEFARAKLPRVTRAMGENLVGPSIIAHGTDEQKAYFLPRIIDGTDRYCQGFSEPDAGSDLAGLKTVGVIDGDEVVITGQKVWTSAADLANMMFVLCRTDSSVPKHRGISYVLVPMGDDLGASNGIELRPIYQITRHAGFFETFLDGARAPLFNVIGGINNGWRVTMTTLGNERGGAATTQHLAFREQLHRITAEAERRGLLADPIVRQKIAWAHTRIEILRYQGLRTVGELVAGKEIGPQASLNKMFWSEFVREMSSWALSILGPDALIRPDGEGYQLTRFQQTFMTTRSGTIWGGTAEVQRNIVGERVLGLPKEPEPAAKATGR